MTWNRIGGLAIVVCAGAAGCARTDKASMERSPSETPAQQPRSSSGSEVEAMSLAQAEAALARADRELGDALMLAVPDCDRARGLRDRICELSGRICRIADTDPESAARCEDSRQRCSRAGTRIAGQCG
jgi:hypothetical protein